MSEGCPRRRFSLPRNGITLAAAFAAVALGGGAESASAWQSSLGERVVAVGPVAGALSLDSHLSDYRWDTKPQPLYGLAGRVGFGRFGAGLRVWRSTTSQATGIPGETASPEVRLTGTEALAELGLFRAAGFRFSTTGSLGLLHLGYSPDSWTFDPGTGEDLTVEFQPIDEWIGGLGLGVRRSVVGGLDLALAVERTWFRLDTAHRAGNEIVNERETFGNWAARIELTHRVLRW